MKVTTTENGEIQIEEVYNPIVLKTRDGEIMAITMRDTGFELDYQGKWYFAKQGIVEPFNLNQIKCHHPEDKIWYNDKNNLHCYECGEEIG